MVHIRDDHDIQMRTNVVLLIIYALWQYNVIADQEQNIF